MTVIPVLLPLSMGEETLAQHLRIEGIIYTREFKFHPRRKWSFDFAIPEKKVAIEVEGGTRHKSRHTSGAGYERDCDKYNAATLLGWRVLRYTTDMVIRGQALKDIMEIGA